MDRVVLAVGGMQAGLECPAGRVIRRTLLHRRHTSGESLQLRTIEGERVQVAADINRVWRRRR